VAANVSNSQHAGAILEWLTWIQGYAFVLDYWFAEQMTLWVIDGCNLKSTARCTYTKRWAQAAPLQ
jgi:hypothetical protein